MSSVVMAIIVPTVGTYFLITTFLLKNDANLLYERNSHGIWIGFSL